MNTSYTSSKSQTFPKCQAGTQNLRNAKFVTMSGNSQITRDHFCLLVPPFYPPPTLRTLPAESLDLNTSSSQRPEQSPSQERCQLPSPISLLEIINLTTVFWQYQMWTDSYECLKFNYISKDVNTPRGLGNGDMF